jgi:hypothetical protein
MAGVTKNGLGIAAKTGNLNLMMNLANGTSSASIKGMVPGFAASFAANFKMSPGTSPKLYGQIAANISSSFAKIDSAWSQARSGVSLSGSLFLNASPDFQRVAIASVGVGSRFNQGTSGSARISPSLPSINRLSLGIRSSQQGVGLNAVSSFTWPSGRIDTYTPRSDGNYDVQTMQPIPYGPGDTDYSGAAVCSVNDPMVLGGSLLLAQQQAPRNFSDSSSQLSSDFPATAFGDVNNSYSEYA